MVKCNSIIERIQQVNFYSIASAWNILLETSEEIIPPLLPFHTLVLEQIRNLTVETMNKYTELSDFEINKLVACKLRCNDEITETLLNKLVFVNGNIFTPCSNPSDAMPIIIENNISLHAPHLRGGWMAEYTGSSDDANDGFQSDYFDAHNKNPYRAAMEVFLMIKDAENEKV